MTRKNLVKDLHGELELRNRELFESQLAVHLIQHMDYFPSVKKISSIIVPLMLSNSDRLISIIKTNPKILQELSEPYFGGFFAENQQVPAHEIFETMISTLKDDEADMSKIMEIHCIFIHRMYDHIETKKDKKEFAKLLFPEDLFNDRSRSRILRSTEITTTSQLGIAKHPVFIKRLQQSETRHARALDKFMPDFRVGFFKSAIDKSIPIVCGPSGHTASLLLGAKLYGDLTDEELMEYTLACFAFLAAGGNHSFHEIYTVARLLGVPYDANNYAVSFPLSMKTTDAFLTFSHLFPQYMNNESTNFSFRVNSNNM